MTIEICEYQKQANDFLKQTGVSFKAEFKEYGYHFNSDECKRDIYTISFKRGQREFSFDFGQSIAKGRYFFDKSTKRKFYEHKEHFIFSDGFKTVKAYKDKFFSAICGVSVMRSDSHSEKELIRRGVLVLGEAPNSYDVLACLTKYDAGTFEDFCSDFGYDTDSKTAETTYNAVCEEFANVQIIWNDSEIELLQEIQ